MAGDRPELEKLRREHEQALLLADRIAALAADGSESSRAQGAQLVSEYYAQELEAHLQHEEQTLFAPLLRHDKDQFALCMRLGKDHGALRAIATGIHADTPADDLDAFARILRDHTRLEDEEFLPLVASLFTPEELEAVVNFTPLPTAATSNGNGR